MSENSDPNKQFMNPDEQKRVQLEKLDRLKYNLTPMNKDFIRKELMLNIDIDVNNLTDPQLFDSYYMLKNKNKEEKLHRITREENAMQAAGVLVGLIFLVFRAKKRDALWLLPGIVSITASKWYSSKYFFAKLIEYDVDEYWRKSKKLDGDLRKVDLYVKQRKFFERFGPDSTL